MHYFRIIAVLLATLFASTGIVTSAANAASGPMPSGPIYGDTLDNAAFGNYSKVITGSQHAQSVGRTLTHRVVVDPGTSPSDYAPAINGLSPYSYIMAELADSSEMSNLSQSAFVARADSWTSYYGLPATSKVNLYEIGNEVNGEWLGTTTDVVNKIHAVWSDVHGKGYQTAMTTYYNPNCYSSSDHQMLPWLSANIPADMKAGLDYVFVSYYEVDCNGHRPTVAEWTSVFDQLHAMFPNAKLGMGEVGLDTAIGTSSTKLTQAQGILSYYYGLQPSDMNTSLYVRGGFWWYGQEDLYPYDTKALWPTFQNAILGY